MRRKATKSPKNKRKAGKGGGGGRPRTGAGTLALPAGGPRMPAAFDPGADELAAHTGLPAGFTPPKLDFTKLTRSRPAGREPRSGG